MLKGVEVLAKAASVAHGRVGLTLVHICHTDRLLPGRNVVTEQYYCCPKITNNV